MVSGCFLGHNALTVGGTVNGEYEIKIKNPSEEGYSE
jgi:hypothetical protein